MKKLFKRIKYRLGTIRRSKNFPVSLHIEPTNACNLNCAMCPQGDGSYKRGFMRFELFKKIIDECAKYPQCNYFILHKDGESFLHPEMTEFIAYLRHTIPQSYIYIATNGHFLTEEINLKLIEYNVNTINISLRAATPETYERIHRKAGYEKVIENIKNLIKLKEKKKNTNPQIVLQIIDTEETKNEIELFKNQWKDYPLNTYVKEFFNWGGARSDVNMKKGIIKRFPCKYLWTRPAINWDGQVSICCLDWERKAIIGKLNKESLYEIWQGEIIKNYRRLHLENKYEQIEICKDCNRWISLINPFFINLLKGKCKWI